MGRAARVLLAAGVILLMTAGPALAQQDRQPVIDLTDFITVDRRRPLGRSQRRRHPRHPRGGSRRGHPGGHRRHLGRRHRGPDPGGVPAPRRPRQAPGSTSREEGAYLFGPCGGAAISYDAHGDSLDAAVDLGDGNPPVDVYGEPAFTAGNPFQVDSGGTVLYFGFTLPDAGLSGDAFHNHRWEMVIMGVSADDGGDPNPSDKNRNAGIMELGDLLPFQFQAKLKAHGVFVDGWGDNELPAYTADDVDGRVRRPHHLLRRRLGAVRRGLVPPVHRPRGAGLGPGPGRLLRHPVQRPAGTVVEGLTMAQTQLKRHPWRAAIWGLILGLGVFVYLTFVWPVIGLDDVECGGPQGSPGGGRRDGARHPVGPVRTGPQAQGGGPGLPTPPRRRPTPTPPPRPSRGE